MKKGSGLVVLLVILAIVVVIAMVLVGQYNSMVKGLENVKTKESSIDVQLQRRADLIPNLVNTVKGYMAHESGVIDSITEARAKLVGANTIEEKAEANQGLTNAIDALMVVVENYPDLKASSNFVQLSDELSGTENRIAVARKDYNEAASAYNLTVKTFPNNIIAGMFNFEQVAYFEADESSKEVPNVQF